ncbi:MAG: hypothetical protein HY319_02105 [Armatimonadetes bacterium]|nr:hypothetical protein [Armatimonadota bacterium]
MLLTLDENQATALRLFLREFRTDGVGPGIPDLRIVRYRALYTDPIELVQTDQDGAVVLEGPGPFYLAIEAPHGRNFYVVPFLNGGTYYLSHPDNPGPTEVVPLDVSLDGTSTLYDQASLRAGTDGTRQRQDASNAAQVPFDLETRNFHRDGSASLVGFLTVGTTTTVRGALRQQPAGGNLTLDTPFDRFNLQVDVANSAATVTEVRARGLLGGTSLPLSPNPFEVFLPAQGVDQLDRYQVDVWGQTVLGPDTANWYLRTVLDPQALAGQIQGGNIDLAIPLDGPFLVDSTEAVNLVSWSGFQPDRSSAPTQEIGCSSGTARFPALLLPGANLTTVQGFRQDGTTWTRLLDEAPTGPMTVAPEMTITDTTATGSVGEQRTDLGWIIRPEGTNALDIQFPASCVSDWYSSYYSDSGAGAAYTFVSVANVGGGGETVTVQFHDEAGAAVASTVSVVAPGATWILATDAGGQEPRPGGTEPVTATGIRLPIQMAPNDVVNRTLQDRTGCVVVTSETWDDSNLIPWSAVYFSSSFASFNMTWRQ